MHREKISWHAEYSAAASAKEKLIAEGEQHQLQVRRRAKGFQLVRRRDDRKQSNVGGVLETVRHGDTDSGGYTRKRKPKHSRVY
jgi:hypothetical protein